MARLVPKLILVLLAVPLCAGCFRKNAAVFELKPKNQIILRLAETLSPDYPSSKGCLEFAKLVAKRSNGRIKIRIFDNGELGDENSVIEQVQFGGIDLARVSSLVLAEYHKKLNLLILPYLYKSEAHLWNTLEGKIGEEFSNKLIAEKLILLGWYDGGRLCFYNTKRELKTVNGFRGLKLGVPRSQLMMDLISNLGGIPVPIEPSDIYNALQNGSIDGAQGNLILYYLSKHYEIAKYFTVDQDSYSPDILLASRVSMMQLTKEDQKIMATAARDSALIQKQIWAKQYRETLASLRKAGVKVAYFSKEEKAKLAENAESVYSLFSKEERAFMGQIRRNR